MIAGAGGNGSGGSGNDGGNTSGGMAGSGGEAGADVAPDCTSGAVEKPPACPGGNGAVERVCVDGAWTERPCKLDGPYRATPPSADVYYGSEPSISADGRFVAFETSGPDGDIFVHDVLLGTTEQADPSMSGGPNNLGSEGPQISADGRRVAFLSMSTVLVADDTNAVNDAFLRDLDAGATTRLSVSSTGAQSATAVAGPVFTLALAGNGRFAIFASEAADLVQDDMSGMDVFLRDLEERTTTRLNFDELGVLGRRGLDISSDGRFIAFATSQAAVSTIVIHDRDGATNVLLTGESLELGEFNNLSLPSLSTDGRVVAFLASTSPLGDPPVQHVYVHDLETSATKQVDLGSSGTVADQNATRAAISGDGRVVAFASLATNLDARDADTLEDIYAHDLSTGETAFISPDAAGEPTNLQHWGPDISEDGRHVAYTAHLGFVPSAENMRVFVAPVPFDGATVP